MPVHREREKKKQREKQLLNWQACRCTYEGAPDVPPSREPMSAAMRLWRDDPLSVLAVCTQVPGSPAQVVLLGTELYGMSEEAT